MSRLPALENSVPEPALIADDTRDDSKQSVEGYDVKRNIPIFVSSIRKDEPIVTRRELWSYYRMPDFYEIVC